jgi:catechol 2,3-dioxygenase
MVAGGLMSSGVEDREAGVVHDSQAGIAAPGYRLPSEAHVGAVHLQVSDLERSLRYYRDVLGLRMLHRDPHDLVLGAAGTETPLLRLHEHRRAAPVARAARLGLYHFAILLPDRAALGRFVAHLARIGERAGASDHLVSEAIYLQDPDGLGIEVYADRPRSAWQTTNGELRMATLPLDVAGVVAAAADVPWDGMPAGTVMGHVHLHVGDLERASAFYHAALGLDKMVWSYTGALFLAAGGYHHHLGLNTWAGASAEPAGEDEPRLIDWQLRLPGTEEVAAARLSMEAAGFVTSQEPDGWAAEDPWGTRLRVVASGSAR